MKLKRFGFGIVSIMLSKKCHKVENNTKDKTLKFHSSISIFIFPRLLGHPVYYTNYYYMLKQSYMPPLILEPDTLRYRLKTLLRYRVLWFVSNITQFSIIILCSFKLISSYIFTFYFNTHVKRFCLLLLLSYLFKTYRM